MNYIRNIINSTLKYYYINTFIGIRVHVPGIIILLSLTVKYTLFDMPVAVQLNPSIFMSSALTCDLNITLSLKLRISG